MTSSNGIPTTTLTLSNGGGGTAVTSSSCSSSSTSTSSQSGSPASQSAESCNGTNPGTVGTNKQQSGTKIKVESLFDDHSEFDLGPVVPTIADIDIDSELSGPNGLLVDSGNCSLTSFSPSSLVGGVTPMSTNGGKGSSLSNGTSLATGTFLTDHLSYTNGENDNDGEPDMLENFLTNWDISPPTPASVASSCSSTSSLSGDSTG